MRELEQQRKGRNKNTIIDYNYISSNRYRKKFDYISNDKKLNKLLRKSFNRFLIISLDVLICRYSPLLRAFPALFI